MSAPTRSYVVVACVQCKAEREIEPGELPADEPPICQLCLAPMVAVCAVANIGKEGSP